MTVFISNIGDWIFKFVFYASYMLLVLFLIIELIKFTFPNVFSRKCENTKCELYEFCNGCNECKKQETQAEPNKTSSEE